MLQDLSNPALSLAVHQQKNGTQLQLHALPLMPRTTCLTIGCIQFPTEYTIGVPNMMQAMLVHVMTLNNHHTTLQQTITPPDLPELDEVAKSASKDPSELSHSPSAMVSVHNHQSKIQALN